MAATTEYQAYGRERPPQAALQQWVEELRLRSSPSIGVVLADMYIDLACADPSSSATYLAYAREVLASVEAQSDRAWEVPAGYLEAFAARAIFRNAELENWGLAAMDKPVTNPYDSLLDAACQVSRFTYDEAQSTIREVIPILLGGRALSRTGIGWFGRFALNREDHGTTGANWDCGLSSDDDPRHFKEPPVLLEVKNKRRSHEKKSHRQPLALDTVRIKAVPCGFGDLPSILASCYKEKGEEVPETLAKASLVSSDYLDGVTDAITERVRLRAMQAKMVRQIDE